MNTLGRTLRLTVLGSIIAIGACTDATAPEPADVFVLTRVDGEPPPILRSRPGGLLLLRTDSLRVLAGGAYVRTTVLEVLDSSFSSSGPTETGVLRAIGDRFVLDADCPDLATCVAPDTIRFFGDQAEIRGSYVLDADLLYRRIR